MPDSGFADLMTKLKIERKEKHQAPAVFVKGKQFLNSKYQS
jgi:hypothetical protein